MSIARHETQGPTASVITQALALQAANATVLVTPVEVARVLCGLSSPAISKAKLQKESLFGSCEMISFSSVVDAVTEAMK